MIEIIYKEVSPDAGQNATATCNDYRSYCDLSLLFQDVPIKKWTTPEHAYTILDASHEGLKTDDKFPLWSNAISDNSFNLSSAVVLEINIAVPASSAGITFTFDPLGKDWCTDLNIKWYNGSTLISDKDFQPKAPVYTCVNEQTNYNRLVVTFKKLNHTGHFLKVNHIDFGLIRYFSDDELESLSIEEAVDGSCRTIPINSATFTINTKDEIPYMFIKRQALEIRYFDNDPQLLNDNNGELMGTYFLDRFTRYAKNKYTLECVDMVGIVDGMTRFLGGMYENEPAQNIINSIINGVFSITIDDSIKNTPITGWLPISNRRDALEQLVLVMGAMVDCTRNNYIHIKPLPSVKSSTLGVDRVYQGALVNAELPCTGVTVTSRRYIVDTWSGQSPEFFREWFTGTKLVEFSSPLSSVSITNGAILEKGVNYAIISSNTGGSSGDDPICIMKGKPYEVYDDVVEIKSPTNLDKNQEKIEQIGECTLVNTANAQAIAQRLYDYYTRQNVFEGDILLQDEKIGDIVEVATAFQEPVTGIIEKLSISLGWIRKKARANIRD